MKQYGRFTFTQKWIDSQIGHAAYDKAWNVLIRVFPCLMIERWKLLTIIELKQGENEMFSFSLDGCGGVNFHLHLDREGRVYWYETGDDVFIEQDGEPCFVLARRPISDHSGDWYLEAVIGLDRDGRFNTFLYNKQDKGYFDGHYDVGMDPDVAIGDYMERR